MKKFSESTSHIIDVVKEIRSSLQLNIALGRELDEAGWKEIVRGAVKDVAAAKNVTVATVDAACQRNLELDAEGFELAVIDHFGGGDQLIKAVCSHCKNIRGEDNPADIRAALNEIRS